MRGTFTIVVPVLNGAATLPRTLTSLSEQTGGRWEAVVVDRGSTDATCAIAETFCRSEARARVIRRPGSTLAQARNAGAREATGTWLLFLDAGDWLLPRKLECIADAADRSAEVDAVYSRWVHATLDGDLAHESPFSPDPARLFEASARSRPFVVHSCAVRRDAVEELGGFDETMIEGSDWDFWQRLARTGRRVTRVDEVLAVHRMWPLPTPDDVANLLAAGLRQIAVGHGEDPRVRRPAPEHRQGLAREGLAHASFLFACWPAGIVLGSGGDARWILDHLPARGALELWANEVAAPIFSAALVARGVPPAAWRTIWLDIAHGVERFLHALEEHSGTRQLAVRAMRDLERRVVDHAPSVRPLTIGRTHACRIDVAESLRDVEVPSSVDRLRCAIAYDSVEVGEIELPVCDGFVPAAVLEDAVAAEWWWTLLGRYFGETIYPSLDRESDGSSVSIVRDGVVLAERVPSAERFELHEMVGWAVLLQELWGESRLPERDFYREAPANDASAQGRLFASYEVSEPHAVGPAAAPGDLTTVTVGGAVVTRMPLPLSSHPDAAAFTRARVIDAARLDLGIVAVREALIGQPLTATSLRERLRRRAAFRHAHGDVASTLALNAERTWHVATAASEGSPGVRPSRRGTLPAETLDELRTSGGRVSRAGGRGDGPPSVVCLSDGIAGELLRPARAPLWRTIRETATRRRTTLPALMYHQVAPTGSAAFARYRVTPDAFREQIRYLGDAGYRSISLADWHRATVRGEPLPSLPVLLTFDDAYRDFAEHAWPVLREHGFTALVFIVSDYVGTTNSWVVGYGEPSRLLDWAEIRRLRDEGVEFGSHTATHPHLTVLSPSDVVREVVRSRAAITRELGAPIDVIAYPHGAEDPAVRHLVEGCGYAYGLSCRPGPASRSDPMLSLPRIEITGQDSLQDFVAKVEV